MKGEGTCIQPCICEIYLFEPVGTVLTLDGQDKIPGEYKHICQIPDINNPQDCLYCSTLQQNRLDGSLKVLHASFLGSHMSVKRHAESTGGAFKNTHTRFHRFCGQSSRKLSTPDQESIPHKPQLHDVITTQQDQLDGMLSSMALGFAGGKSLLSFNVWVGGKVEQLHDFQQFAAPSYLYHRADSHYNLDEKPLMIMLVLSPRIVENPCELVEICTCTCKQYIMFVYWSLFRFVDSLADQSLKLKFT